MYNIVKTSQQLKMYVLQKKRKFKEMQNVVQ